MNLVGKIFVVVIFVMSLVFMGLAMAVYATHKNWQDVVINPQTGLNYKLKEAQALNAALKDQLGKLTEQINAETSAQQQAVSKLRTELDVVQKERRELETSRADLEKAKRDAVAAMSATQKNASDSRQELEKLRTDILQAQQDRDAHFKEVVRLTDELNATVNDKEQLRKRMADLGKDLAKVRDALRWFKIDENKDFRGKVPSELNGRVMATVEHGLLEISLGSDDGLRKGHLLEVYRRSGGQSTYVGRIEVVQVSPDKSVCKIDPKFQNANVMVGDSVAAKID